MSAPLRADAPPTRRVIVFDLDGTLAASKSAVDAEMSTLLCELLAVVSVAVISGGDWPQFEAQLLPGLPVSPRLERLTLLPTCGTKLRVYRRVWTELYSEDLTADAKGRIVAAMATALETSGLGEREAWGDVIEDRGSQITLSALGQHAPLAAKLRWDPDLVKRRTLQVILEELLPEFSVRVGGTTSIDVTRKGIDKAYGIHKLRDVLGILETDMLFIGDAMFPGGNDQPAREAGVTCIQVRDPGETKRVIETLLACLGRS